MLQQIHMHTHNIHTQHIHTPLTSANDTESSKQVWVPIWKGPQLYHENLRITRAFPPMISTNIVKKLYTAALHDMLPEIHGRPIHTVINSWRQWQDTTVRKRYQIQINRVEHCVLPYQLLYTAANNSTGSLPRLLLLSVLAFQQFILASSIPWHDDARYCAPTPPTESSSSRLCSWSAHASVALVTSRSKFRG